MRKLLHFWSYVSMAGVKDSLPFPIQKRVILSNQFAIIIGFISLSFTLLLLFRKEASLLPTITVTILTSSIYFINRFGSIKLSRFLVCIIPLIGLLFLNISTKINIPESIGIVHFISPRMLIISMMALPLTLFTLEEKWPLIGTLMFPFLGGFFFEDINQVFGVGSETLALNQSFRPTLFEDLILQTAILLGTFLFLLNLNKQYEKINNTLLAEAEAKNKNLYSNEEKLRNSLKELEIAQKEDDQRNWITKGIAEIGQLLRSYEKEDIYEVIIAQIVKYIGANQGGIYVADFQENAIKLQLEGCYAYGRKKYHDQIIDAGEGLLGQCFIEGNLTHLTEIPEGYIDITSGLGEATPNSLVLLPLKLNNKTEGVVEVASFGEFADYKLDFLEKMAESLALFIANKRSNEQTQKLLKEAETATVTLRAQENEMRKNFEELQATKEEMENKEQHYLSVIDELKLKINNKTV